MLRAESVSFSYNGKEILHSVSMAVPAGDFIGIIGPNGAGKSTLLRILSGILRPREGTVHLDGRPVGSLKARDISKIMAVLPAETFHPYDFSVLEIVMMGRAPHLKFMESCSEQDMKIVHHSMKAAGVDHLSERSIHALSSGERQRVYLAQAMAQGPKILLLDEPTVHLDIQHQIKLFQLLKDWNESGQLSILAISHDLNIASRFCKKLVLMDQGKIVTEGTPKEVITEENIQKTYKIKTRVIAGPNSPAVLIE